MSRIIAGINMTVQCADGRSQQGVTLAVEGTQRVYIAQDGTELHGVECIKECTSLLPPVVLAALLNKCKECDS